MAIGPRGDIFVAQGHYDTNPHPRVLRFDKTYLGLPCGLYLDRTGTMYLVTGWTGQLLKLDANGKAIAATGEPGKGLGRFGEAHYLTVGPAGEIYVADTSNSFLHKFVKK